MGDQALRRGWLDTRQVLETVFKQDEMVKMLVTKNCNLYFDFANNNVEDHSKMAYILAYAGYALRELPIPTPEHIQAVSIGELIAPVLPTTHFLSEAAANIEVTARMKYLMSNSTVVNRRRTKSDFIAMYNALDAEARANDGIEIPPNITDDRFLELYGEEYTDFLLTRAQGDMRLKPIELFCTMFLAVAKRGNVTREFMDKIVKGLESDLQYVADLNPDVVNLTYKFYGGYVDETNAQQLLDAWLRDLPEHALRVRLTLQQATNTGLTALTIIGRAMIKYPDFNWAKLNKLFQGELTNYLAAVTAVNGNQYYGFKKSLGVVRSTLYSSLAYVAKELLIQLNGESSLKKYAGGVRSPKNAAVVSNMILEYRTQYTDAAQSDAVDPDDQALMTSITGKLSEVHIREMFA